MKKAEYKIQVVYTGQRKKLKATYDVPQKVAEAIVKILDSCGTYEIEDITGEES